MRIATFVTAASVMVLGTFAFAQSVTYDYDQSANFSRFHTYAWLKGTPVSDELNHKRIVQAIETQLAAKGLSRSESGANADVFVAYHAAFDKSLQISASSSGFGAYRFGAMRTGTARADEILVGTLVVDIVDAKSETIVWRGTASKDINVKANAEKRDKSINKAAEKLFKNYPPSR